jgi:hypothetical protein
MIRQRLWGLVVMAVMVAGLYVALRQDDKQTQTEHARLEKAQRLFAVDNANEVESLTLEGPQGRLVLVQGSNGVWHMESPVKSACDPGAILGFVGAFFDTRIQNRVGSQTKQDDFKTPVAVQADLKLFELDPAAYTVTLKLRNGVLHRLKVGKRNSFDGSFYVSGDDFPFIGMIDGALSYQLQQEADSLREKRPIVVQADQIREVQVSDANGLRFHVKKEGDAFLLVAPFQARANAQEVDDLFGALSNVRGSDFVVEQTDSNSAAHLGLDKPTYRVLVVEKTGQQHEMLLLHSPQSSGEKEWLVTTAVGAHPLMTLASTDICDKLGKDPKSWEDMQVMHIRPHEVERLVLKQGNKRLELKRRKADKSNNVDTWFAASDETLKLDYNKINTLLLDLSVLKAEHILARDKQPTELVSFGLHQPQWELELWGKGESSSPLVKVLSQPTDNQKVYIYSSDSKRVDTMPANVLEQWSVDVQHYSEQVASQRDNGSTKD